MKLFKNGFYKILLFSLILTLIIAGCSTDNGSNNTAKKAKNDNKKLIEIKFGINGPMEHPYGIGAAKFKELVESKSNDQIKVTIFPNGQLGSERELAESVKMGTLQMTAVTVDGVLPAWVPEFQIFALPYLFRDEAHVYKVLDGEVGQYLNGLLESHGIKNLGYWQLGWRHFTNNKREVKTASDMKDLKLRIQEAKVWFALTDALGATASPMPFNELYTALQQGVVDGQENPPKTILSSKFYEVQKYLTLDAHTFSAGGVLINKSFFENLTVEQKQWIQDAIDETAQYQRNVITEETKKDIEFLRTEGKMTVTTPDRQTFIEATKDIPNQVKDLVPLDLVDKIRAIQ